jgi:hypothetical protein
MLTQLKALWVKLNTNISELWSDSKVFVIIFGVLIVILKFRSILVNFIVLGAKSIFNQASQQSSADQNQESKDNNNANDLINQANILPDNQPPVTPDWYKK